MQDLGEEVERLARDTNFSGVVRIDSGGEVVLSASYGWANRAAEVPNAPGTRFGIASGTKGFTALVVASLIEEGRLDLSTTARSVLGSDLPLIDDAVTVEHLLAHRSGIGDYLDEEAGYDLDDYVLTVPVHQLAGAEDYLAVLDGYPQKFPPGQRFSYCNSGYAVLAVIAERVGGAPFHDLVHARVCGPAGMGDTAFLRSDELPTGAALGYLAPEGLRTNVFHLPVRGTGDGGIYSTADDISAFWAALFAGRIVPPEWVARMVAPRSDAPAQSMRYGLGFWLHPHGDGVVLEGCDAGVSFRTTHDPATKTTRTVLSNTSAGAWPICQRLDELLAPIPNVTE